MRLTPTDGQLHGPEGICPPLPYIEVADEEHAASLIARGLAQLYTGDAESPPETPADVAPVVASDDTDPSVGDGAPEPVVEPNGQAAGSEVPPGEDKLRDIADHIELLSDDDKVKTGPRAGKPKLDVLKSALGYDVTAEEVDAALALEI